MKSTITVTASVKTKWFFVPMFFAAAVLVRCGAVSVKRATRMVMAAIEIKVSR